MELISLSTVAFLRCSRSFCIYCGISSVLIARRSSIAR
jgi:hypothetical protein